MHRFHCCVCYYINNYTTLRCNNRWTLSDSRYVGRVRVRVGVRVGLRLELGLGLEADN